MAAVADGSLRDGAAPILRLTAATKRFGSTVAVDGVDLEVADGEILALVGPSGCGKTTLLRSIAGLVGLDDGRIELAGEVVDDGRRQLPPERRSVGLVFQEHSLFAHLSVLDNVRFGIRDAGRGEATARARAALELVELAHLADRFPHELSGGERQRVALARALAPRPRLMLFDEPFASLDPNLRTQLRRDVLQALRTTGTPAVFVTHDQTEALAIGDRVAVLRAGRIQHVGAPYEVFHTPRSRFVAAFMGDASFLPVADGHTALGPIDTTADLAMVRPDDVDFTGDREGDTEVTSVEFRGERWICTLRLPDGTELIANRSHLAPVAVGDRGRVALVPGHRLVPITDPT